MAKRKDLLLNESTVSRFMGLAGIGALTNPFLREQQDQVAEMNYAMDDSEEGEMDEMMGHDDSNLEEEYDGLEEGEYGEGYMDEDSDLMEGEEDEEEDEESDEEECEKCGKVHEGSCKGYMQENINKSMKRLKSLLEQAEAGAEPPAPEGGEEMPPEPAPGGAGDDEMEAKIKEFVKKLGELVQETLGVQVTVEEGEGEPEMPEMGAAPAAGGAEAPAPMAEAINRLVNKVAHRVKARLMEAKKDPKVAAAKAKKMKMMKEKQIAAKKKEKEEAAKKKEMEMKKKKAAEAKKK